MLLKKRQEDAKRKEEEETRKCEEEVARQNRISAARFNLEIKLAEKGNLLFSPACCMKHPKSLC